MYPVLRLGVPAGFSEEFCEIFRAKDKTTGKLHTCKKFQKRDWNPQDVSVRAEGRVG